MMYYVVEYFNFVRKIWSPCTLNNCQFVECEESEAKRLFFTECLNKRGDYRLQSVVTFPNGDKKYKTISSLRNY